MKQILYRSVACLFLLLTLTAFAEAQPDVNPIVEGDQTEMRDGKLFLIGKDKPYTGQVNFFYPSDTGEGKGPRKTTSNYKDGLLHGEYTDWFKNGTVKWKGTYKNDKAHGEFVSYYLNGNKEREGELINGKVKVGVFSSWYENGQLKEKGKYDKKGKKQGVFNYWFENGQMESEEIYKDGAEHGVCKWWTEEGKLEFEEHFKNGKSTKTIEY